MSTVITGSSSSSPPSSSTQLTLTEFPSSSEDPWVTASSDGITSTAPTSDGSDTDLESSTDISLISTSDVDAESTTDTYTPETSKTDIPASSTNDILTSVSPSTAVNSSSNENNNLIPKSSTSDSLETGTTETGSKPSTYIPPGETDTSSDLDTGFETTTKPTATSTLPEGDGNGGISSDSPIATDSPNNNGGEGNSNGNSGGEGNSNGNSGNNANGGNNVNGGNEVENTLSQVHPTGANPTDGTGSGTRPTNDISDNSGSGSTTNNDNELADDEVNVATNVDGSNTGNNIQQSQVSQHSNPPTQPTVDAAPSNVDHVTTRLTPSATLYSPDDVNGACRSTINLLTTAVAIFMFSILI